MTRKSKDVAGTKNLNLMGPTPESKATLDKQPRCENIWHLEGDRIFLMALGFSPVLVSALFGYVILQLGLHSYSALVMAIAFVAQPLWLAGRFVLWARHF